MSRPSVGRQRRTDADRRGRLVRSRRAARRQTLGFSEWDDDATRRFIRESDCSVPNRLTQDDIRQLLLNLFEGDTHDEDEGAILRLIRCLPCGRVRDLLERRGLSYDDFDDEVDGSEWDELQPILLFARDRCLG